VSTILMSALFAVSLFLGVLVCLSLGWRLGRRRMARLRDNEQLNLGPLEGAIFGLMGLLIAFTFTGAANRFDARRQLIVQHANAIGTAWMRLDLLPDAPRVEVQNLFRQYLDLQLALVSESEDPQEVTQRLGDVSRIQDDIWLKSVSASKLGNTQPLVVSLLPALNEMFDIAENRIMASKMHPPLAIYTMLGILVLVSALLAGFAMSASKSLSYLHAVGFALTIAASVYLILDLENPRVGLLRVDDFDVALVTLRESMN